MAHLLLILVLLASMSGGPTTQPAGHAPGSRPTSRPTTQPATEAVVRRLVRQLGAAEYAVRESAQKQLADMGEVALPYLMEFIGGENPEVSNRVASVIRRPKTPALRVEIAARLLSTADPDQMECGVYMLFESPIEDYDLFVQHLRKARGVERAIFEPVAERLAVWKEITERFNQRYAKLRREKPEAAARELKNHRETKYYQAEAAYWPALEALEEYEVRDRPFHRPTTRPGQ